jgi:hypothetical protein
LISEKFAPEERRGKSRHDRVDPSGAERDAYCGRCHYLWVVVGGEYAELLEAAGVDSVSELCQRSAANLAAKLEEVNQTKKPVRALPTESQVSGWIEQATGLPSVVRH